MFIRRPSEQFTSADSAALAFKGPTMADSHANATRDALDELAALFLTPAATDAPAQSTPTDPAPQPSLPPRRDTTPHPQTLTHHADEPPAIAHQNGQLEAVVLGHLPGFASPWATQYAHALAQRDGGDVAMIYLEDAAVRIDVVHCEQALDNRPPTMPPTEATTLTDAVGELAGRVSRWLVVVGDPDQPRARPWLQRLDQWTLISAADEAAIVGAYRTLKSLTAATRTEPHVRIMFAGCDEQQADEAMARLSRATGKHLNLPLDLAVVRRRIEPARRHTAGTFEVASDPAAQIIEAIHHATQPTAAPPPARDDQIETHPAAPAADPAPHRNAQPGEPRPDEPPQAAERDDQPQPSLAPYVAQNLTPLQARCPRCPQVELAVDQQGALHLLRRCDERTPADAALLELIESRAWAVEHAALLAMTCERSALAADPPPRLHLFTDQPAPLLAKLGHAAATTRRLLSLHLLKPVELAGRVTHVHAALTDPECERQA